MIQVLAFLSLWATIPRLARSLHLTMPPSSHSLDSFLGFLGSAAKNRLAWDGKGVLDVRETRTQEEVEVMDLEKEIVSSNEEVVVEATTDLLLFLALVGVSSPPSR